jgi:DNA-binding FadR family transcriptional regulator
MPSDRVLVEQPQTSRATVREALRILDEIQI